MKRLTTTKKLKEKYRRAQTELTNAGLEMDRLEETMNFSRLHGDKGVARRDERMYEKWKKRSCKAWGAKKELSALLAKAMSDNEYDDFFNLLSQ